MTKFFLLAILVCGLANFICSVLILRRLNSAGIQVGYYEMRWQVHKHLKTYQQLCMTETGRIGLPFYGYWGSLGGLVLCVGLFFLSLSR